MSHTVQQALNNVYLRATGKATTMDITSTKGIKILALLNYFQEDWASDSTTDWHSLRSIFTLSNVVSATDTYPLGTLANFNHASRQEGDFVRIYWTNGVNESDYSIVDAAKLYADGRQLLGQGQQVANADGTCAFVGTNLVFDRAFLSTDPQVGGTIKFPGYTSPATLSAVSDIIACDDPEWLEVRCAAEYVRNDITRVQLFPSLMDEATDKMATMRAENDSQIDRVYTGGWKLLGQTWN